MSNNTDESASGSFLDDLPTGVTVGIFVGLFLVVIFICFCVIYCVCNRPLRSNSHGKGKQQFTMTNRVELEQEMSAGKMNMNQMELSFSNPLQKTRKKEKGSQHQSIFDDDDQTDLRKTPLPGVLVGGEGTNQLTLGRQFVPSNLTNDISPKEKQLTLGKPHQNQRQTPNASLSGSQMATNPMATMPKSNKHNTMTASTMSRATNDGASGKELVDKLVIAGDTKQRTERRKRGLSYGRLDEDAQKRIASVRLQAEQILLKPIQNRPEEAQALEQEGENAFPIPLSPQQSAAPASKEEIKKKIKRIAQGAGGGIYTTGGSTAALSGEIIGGFQERRKKRETTEMNLRDLENGNWRADGSSAPPASPRSEFQSSQPPSPASSSRTHRNVIQPKPGQTKLGAFLETTADSSPDQRETDL